VVTAVSDDVDPAVAYHEMGHVVIAVHHGLEFKGVSIEPDDEGEGHFAIKGPFPWTETYSECQAERRHGCAQHHQVAIAGAETVVLFFPDRTLLGDKIDRWMADRCLRELFDSETEQKEYDERLTAETRSLLQRYRPAIEELATKLIELRALDGNRLRELAQKAVDGCC
jgi:hypothetical protein